MNRSDDFLATWCADAFGSAPDETLFAAGHLARVVGYRLRDGREVVLKLRPAGERLLSCLDVQMYLHGAGFPCPQPLVGPAWLHGQVVTGETYVPRGDRLEGADAAPKFAAALARLLALTAGYQLRLSLDPPPPWLCWDNGDALWPPADDVPDDLNAIDTPWLDSVAGRAAAVLKATTLPRAVGHADWTSTNLEWHDGDLHVVHDWDSLAYLPEAALAGGASVLYCSASSAVASVQQSEAFLAAYEASRGRAFTDAERAVAWAAGLWNLAFDAKKDVACGGGAGVDRLRDEAEARLRLAGV